MTEDDLARVQLLRAIEGGGSAAAYTQGTPAWMPELIAAAEADARRSVGEGAAPEAFVARRAELALQALARREPALLPAVAAPLPWGAAVRRRMAWGLVLGAGLLAGLGESGWSGGRIPVLSAPLALLLVWNLAVYLGLAWRSLRRGSPIAGPASAADGPAGVALASAVGQPPVPLQRGWQRLLLAWDRLAGPAVERSAAVASWRAEAARTAWPLWQPVMRPWAWSVLHAAAAAVALGVIASMYLRGLVLDFRAGWESTFLDAHQVHLWLSGLLAPAALLPSLALPDVAGIAGMRWDVAGGVPAGPWIHRMAITLGLLVVLPRGLLAWSAARAARTAAADLLPDRADPYLNRLWRVAPARAMTVTVVPYNCRASADAPQALQDRLASQFGAGAQAVWQPVLPLGAEDALEHHLPGEWPGPVLVLMDLAATPERETHGRFLQRLRALLPPGIEAELWLDSSGLTARLGQAPDAAQRLAQRTEAWRRVAAAAGFPAPRVEPLRPPRHADATAATQSAGSARP